MAILAADLATGFGVASWTGGIPFDYNAGSTVFKTSDITTDNLNSKPYTFLSYRFVGKQYTGVEKLEGANGAFATGTTNNPMWVIIRNQFTRKEEMVRVASIYALGAMQTAAGAAAATYTGTPEA